MKDQGDPWFDPIYKKYSPKLIAVANAVLGNEHTAEDIVQDVFIVLLAKRERAEEFQNIGSWLYKVLYFRIGSEIQKAHYAREVPLDLDNKWLAVVDREDFRLEDVLPEGLTQEERQLLIWRYQDQLSAGEIADRMGRTENVIYVKLHRIKEKWKKLTAKK